MDLATAGQAEQSLKNIEANLKRAKERLAATQDAAAKKALEETVATFESRRAALQKQAKADATGTARTHLLSYIQLGADVPSDPTVQKLVERIEPPGGVTATATEAWAGLCSTRRAVISAGHLNRQTSHPTVGGGKAQEKSP